MGIEDWTRYATDPEFMRPAEVDILLGQPREGGIRARLAQGVHFEQLVARMVDHDLELFGAS